MLLGGAQSSAFYDVAIIDDTLAYAVGEVYLTDSTGQVDPLPYNLAKWNGVEWNLQRVTVEFQGNEVTAPLNAIFAFSHDDIWLSSGVPIHGDGNSWTQYHLFDMGVLTPSDGSINKIWGSSTTSIYFAGSKGTIVYFNGTNWQKLESGTTVDLRDVWGTGDDNVWITGLSSSFGESVLLHWNGNAVTKIYEYPSGSGTPGDTSLAGTAIASVWTDQADSLVVITSGGDYVLHPSNSWRVRRRWKPPAFQTGWPLKVRGSAWNDVFGTGQIGTLYHFNGANTHVYWEYIDINTGPDFHSVATNGRMVIAVGDGATILRGLRP